MLRNKLLLPFVWMLLLPCLALGESLIPQEMIQAETVHYRQTMQVEKSDFQRQYAEQASEYYPYTAFVRFEGESARFVDYLVKRGTVVKKGDPLASLDIDTDPVALAAKEKALLRMEEAYAAGRLQKEEEIRTLLEDYALLQDTFDKEIHLLTIQRAQLALEQYCWEQQHQMDTLRLEIADLRERHAQTTLLAPCDGVVTDLTFKQAGDVLTPYEKLVAIRREDDMLLRISNESGHFRYGMAVQVAVGPAKSRTMLTGQVVASDLLLMEGQRSGYAYVRLDPSAGALPSIGIPPSVSAAYYDVKNVIIASSRAIKADGGKYYVQKLTGGKLEKRYVTIALKGPSVTWVLQGLEEGETIIID